jgi:hypothetical protein
LAVVTALAKLVAEFVASMSRERVEIYNEFSLQHEFGFFLRKQFPDYVVQFERNISHFTSAKSAFTKRELDVAVFTPDRKKLKLAVELKFPRSGQHPEQMFSFCKDIAFAEQLKSAGFSAAALLVFVDDRLFYQGSGNGIYGYFRAGRPINGRIEKPTGAKNQHVVVAGSYTARWQPASEGIHYALIEV